MRNFLLYFTILSMITPAMAECEAVPANQREWQKEPVVSRKVREVDAVFIGTVSGTTPPQENQCTATITASEIFKGIPGREVVATQFDNRYEGANENKCTHNWVKKGESYLFYLVSPTGRQGKQIWYFAFCSLDSHMAVKSATKEIAIIRKLAGR